MKNIKREELLLKAENKIIQKYYKDYKYIISKSLKYIECNFSNDKIQFNYFDKNKVFDNGLFVKGLQRFFYADGFVLKSEFGKDKNINIIISRNITEI